MGNDHPHTTVQESRPETTGLTAVVPGSPTSAAHESDLPSPTTTVFTHSSAHSPITDTTHVDPPPLPDTPQDPHSADPVDLVAQGTSMPPASRVTSELDDPEVKDLGWRQDSVRAPALIQGITNDDLFMIVRRFNKVRGFFCVCFASTHSTSASATCKGSAGPSSRIP